MLTLEEVKNFLEIDSTELEKYIKKGKLHAYKIGGTYLRFRKDEVINLRFEIHPYAKAKLPSPVTIRSRLYDFWRFNNFYIISLLIAAAVVFYVIRS